MKLNNLCCFFLFMSWLTFSPFNLLAEEPGKTIGMILPLSGGYAEIGDSLKNAAMLASESFDPKNSVRIVIEDDQYLPKNAISAAQKLIAVDRIQAAFVFGSPSLATADIFERAKIPMISISTDQEASKDRQYVLRHWMDADDEATILNQELNRRGLKSVAILTTQSDGYLAVRNQFRPISSADIVYDEQIEADNQDFRMIAAKVAKLNPDAVFILLGPSQVSTAARQLRNINYKGQFFSIHSIEFNPDARNSQKALLNTWYAAGDERMGGTFIQGYLKAFGSLPVSGTANGYDITKLLIEAVNSQDPNSYLHQISNFSGAYGTYSLGTDNSFDIPVAIKTITEHGFSYTD